MSLNVQLKKRKAALVKTMIHAVTKDLALGLQQLSLIV